METETIRRLFKRIFYKRPNIKVGDIVSHRGREARVIMIDRDYVLSSTNILFQLNVYIYDLKLVKSINIPDVYNGDKVIIHDIPKDERQNYPGIWWDDCKGIFDSSRLFTVLLTYEHKHYGRVVTIEYEGRIYNLLAYHIEVVRDYDIF